MYPSKDYFRTTGLEDDLKDGATASRKAIALGHLSKDEALKVFQQLLSDLGVTSSWKWEDVNRVVMDEERSKVFKSTAERKHAFQDYVKQLRNAEKEQQQERKQ